MLFKKKIKTKIILLSVLSGSILYADIAIANTLNQTHQNNSYFPNQNHQPIYPQPNIKWGPAHWMNQMSSPFAGQGNQYGNVFRDGKGFYQWMGNGKTRYKFYFDFNFQADMDAWIKRSNQANLQRNIQQNLQQNMHRNSQFNNQFTNQNQQQFMPQGQWMPGYVYPGQGYYQGNIYPQR